MNPYRGADVPEVSFSPLSLTKLKYIIGQMIPPGSCDTWHHFWIWFGHILGVNFILGCLGLRIFLNSAVWWIWFIIPSPLFLASSFCPPTLQLFIRLSIGCRAMGGHVTGWSWDNFSALKPLKISMFNNSTVLAIQRMRPLNIQTSRDLTHYCPICGHVGFHFPTHVTFLYP